MSFILDALRRADRERESERGGVPSLYTQAAPSPIANPQADDEAPRPWLWLAAGLGGGLILAAVWALWSATPAALPTAPAPSAPTPQAAAPPPVVVATPPSSPAPALSRQDARAVDAGRDAAPAEASPSPTANDNARPAPPRMPEPAARAQPQPRAATPPPPARERESSARSEAAREPAATPSRAGDDAAPASSNTPPIRQMSELSAEQRGRLPTLTFGGAMYSANAANRRLIVNGQLLSEGDAVAPGVTLEEIRLKSAVLRTKDLRVELGF